MQTSDTPFGVAFDMQQQTLRWTTDAVTRGVETHREFSESLLDFDPARQASERSYEAARTIVDAYVDAVAAMLPDQQQHFDDVHALLDEQFDALEARQRDTIDAAETNAQTSAEAIKETLDAFVATLGEADDDLAELQAEFESHRETLLGNVETTVDEFETQLRDLQEEIEAVADTETPVDVEVTDDPSGSARPLEAIDGIGPTYAERLGEHGIASLDALAAADTETVAAAADVSESRAGAWIDAAGATA